jgi:hypothetical protein
MPAAGALVGVARRNLEVRPQTMAVRIFRCRQVNHFRPRS